VCLNNVCRLVRGKMKSDARAFSALFVSVHSNGAAERLEGCILVCTDSLSERVRGMGDGGA